MNLKNQPFISAIKFCNSNKFRIRHESWKSAKTNQRIYFCDNSQKIIMEVFDYNNDIWSISTNVPFPTYYETLSYGWEVFEDDLNLINPTMIKNYNYLIELISSSSICPEPRIKFNLTNKLCYNEEQDCTTWERTDYEQH